MRPYTNNMPVKKKYLIEQYKMHTLVIYLLSILSCRNHSYKVQGNSYQFSSLNPGRHLSSSVRLSRLNSSEVMMIWITTTIAQIYKWPKYSIMIMLISIHRDEYVRIHIVLYLFWSSISKWLPFNLLSSGNIWHKNIQVHYK